MQSESVNDDIITDKPDIELSCVTYMDLTRQEIIEHVADFFVKGLRFLNI